MNKIESKPRITKIKENSVFYEIKLSKKGNLYRARTSSLAKIHNVKNPRPETTSSYSFDDAINKLIPKIKISENTEKMTNPGYKRVYRLFENETGKAIADLIAFYDEEIDCTKDLTIYHQSDIWKFKTIEANTYTVEELQVPIFEDGKFVYQELSVKEIRDYSMQEKARLWDEIFRLEFPHNYYVDLTKNLLDFKIKMLEEKRK